jgi:hypothetical protein
LAALGSVSALRLRCGGRSWWSRSRAGKLANGREHFPPMPKQDADILEILIGQMAECRDIDPVLGKALSVLGHAKFFEPVRNLLHRGPPREFIVP